MRRLSLPVLFCVSLATASGALALDYDAYPRYDVVLSVDGWPKIGSRADGKIDAGSFSFLTQVPQASTSGKSTVQGITLRVPLGDSAVLFMSEALEARALKTVLIEGFPHGAAKPAGRAPFAVRLSDVRVSSVKVDVDYGEALVTLQASTIEVFTANQSATGAMQPGLRFGWDTRAGKKM
jgi:type VI protein secretion system component Hcp